MALVLDGSTGIVSANIADGTISAGDLSGSLDLTGKTVTLPSGVGGKVIGMSSITLDKTSNNYSGLNSFGINTVYYIDAAKRSVVYTKQNSSSVLLVHFNYTFRTNGSGNGSHAMVVYSDTAPTTNYHVMTYDMNRMATNGSGATAFSSTVPFTGMATGTHQFNVVPCRRTNDSSMSLGINGYSGSDQSDGETWIYVLEVLA